MNRNLTTLVIHFIYTLPNNFIKETYKKTFKYELKITRMVVVMWIERYI